MTSAFLTEDLAMQALDICGPAIEALLKIGGIRRSAMHVAILEPSSDFVIAERNFGEIKMEDWESPFADIAVGKARLAHRVGMDTSVVLTHHAHLLQSGDPKYPGGVNRNGLVVGASGVQGYLDAMVAGWVADTCQGLCQLELDKIRNNTTRHFV